MVITLVAVAAGVSLASTNVHADVATQTVPTTTLTSSPQDGQVNAGDNIYARKKAIISFLRQVKIGVRW